MFLVQKKRAIMIITRLFGGLGNQMFQYAAGRRLAHVLAVELKLDVTWMDKFISRPYTLGKFNIQENFATAAEIAAMAPKGRIEHALAKIWPKKWPKYIQEKCFHFDPEILNLYDGVYLKGYWQSEKYFSDIAAILRREFTLKTPLSGKSKELSEMIASKQSVSIHIRRGDYVAARKTKRVHGGCGPDYYLRCVDYLKQLVKNAHFFIFSDDPEWAGDNLKRLCPATFVDYNRADKDYEDLWLMSRCNHHIIANSTFSWWGAWLNPREDKIVLAPRQWFDKKIQVSMKMDDLFPSGWILL
ncbi:MAG: alpha-1,2-fucosyltransferase [Sedimentisphaerales bacterium]|jgi:hypothetical protein